MPESIVLIVRALGTFLPTTSSVAVMHYLGRLISITLSYSLLVAIAERLFILIARTCIWKSRYGAEKPHTIATPDVLPSEVIKPIHDFQYSLVEPIRYRPFETKRHIVMGMSKARAKS